MSTKNKKFKKVDNNIEEDVLKDEDTLTPKEIYDQKKELKNKEKDKSKNKKKKKIKKQKKTHTSIFAKILAIFMMLLMLASGLVGVLSYLVG